MTPAVMSKNVNRLFLRHIAMILGLGKDVAFATSPDKLAEWVLEHAPTCTEEQRKLVEEQLVKARAVPADYEEIFTAKEAGKKKPASKAKAAEKQEAAPAPDETPTEDLTFRLESMEKAMADVQGSQRRIEAGLLAVVKAVTEHSEIESLGDLLSGE